jgi:hypothetical protein
VKYFFIILFLTACAHSNKPSAPNESDQVEQLRARYDGWQAELKVKADPNTGWFSADCDGTLWEGEAVASGFPGQLGLAELDGGLVGRRPAAAGDCYPAEAKAQTSPDMRQGYLLGAWATKDLQGLERVEVYGRKRNFLTGLPTDDLGHSLWRPSEIGLLYRTLSALGDDVAPGGEGEVGLACLPVLSDFELHVQTLAILLDGEVSGGVSNRCLDALKANAERSPSDALFQAALGVYSGDLDHVIKLLLDDGYTCPSYVRSGPKYPDAAGAYCTIHKAYAARVVLKRYGD